MRVRQPSQPEPPHVDGCRCRACWSAYMRAYRRRRASRLSPYFAPVEPVSIGLTPLGQRILAAKSRQTGRRPRDIVERLLREHANASVLFPEATSTGDT